MVTKKSTLCTHLIMLTISWTTPYLPRTSTNATGIFTFTAHSDKIMLGSFDHQILSFVLLPDLKLILNLGRFLLLTTLWNSLPDDVKSANSVVTFHRHLKIYLFHLAYLPYRFNSRPGIC